MELLVETALVGLRTLLDVLPLATVVLVFQYLVLRRSLPHPRRNFVGFAYVVVGLALFLIGLEHGLFPIGKTMAEQLTAPEFVARASVRELKAAMGDSIHWQDYYWVYLFAGSIGFATTIAEPALIAITIKAKSVSGGTVRIWGLRLAVAVGVALGVGLGSYRIVSGGALSYFLAAAYVVVIAQTALARTKPATRTIIPLAFDAGGVTTSTVTVPLVVALGLGLAANVPGRSLLIDGFGLIALASVFPIITVLAYAQLGTLGGRRIAPSYPKEGQRDEV